MSFFFHSDFLLFEKLIGRYFQSAGQFTIMVEAVHDEFTVLVDDIMRQAEHINPSAVHKFQTDAVLAVPAAADGTLDKFDLDVPQESARIEDIFVKMVSIDAARDLNVYIDG